MNCFPKLCVAKKLLNKTAVHVRPFNDTFNLTSPGSFCGHGRSVLVSAGL